MPYFCASVCRLPFCGGSFTACAPPSTVCLDEKVAPWQLLLTHTALELVDGASLVTLPNEGDAPEPMSSWSCVYSGPLTLSPVVQLIWHSFGMDEPPCCQ